MSNYKHQNWDEAKEKALVQLICVKGGIQGNVMTGRGRFSKVLNQDADANNRRGWWGTTDKAADGIRKGIRNKINNWKKDGERTWREALAYYQCYDQSIDAGVRPQEMPAAVPPPHQPPAAPPQEPPAADPPHQEHRTEAGQGNGIPPPASPTLGLSQHSTTQGGGGRLPRRYPATPSRPQSNIGPVEPSPSSATLATSGQGIIGLPASLPTTGAYDQPPGVQSPWGGGFLGTPQASCIPSSRTNSNIDLRGPLIPTPGDSSYSSYGLSWLLDAGFGPDLFEDMGENDIIEVKNRLSHLSDQRHTRIDAENDIFGGQVKQTIALQFVQAKKRKEASLLAKQKSSTPAGKQVGFQYPEVSSTMKFDPSHPAGACKPTPTKNQTPATNTVPKPVNMKVSVAVAEDNGFSPFGVSVDANTQSSADDDIFYETQTTLDEPATHLSTGTFGPSGSALRRSCRSSESGFVLPGTQSIEDDDRKPPAKRAPFAQPFASLPTETNSTAPTIPSAFGCTTVVAPLKPTPMMGSENIDTTTAGAKLPSNAYPAASSLDEGATNVGHGGNYSTLVENARAKLMPSHGPRSPSSSVADVQREFADLQASGVGVSSSAKKRRGDKLEQPGKR